MPPAPLPTLEQLRQRHAEHVENLQHWQVLDAIVAGGRQVNKQIKQLLLANPDGRPPNVVEERLKVATFCNKVGPILSRFNAELFSEPASKIGSKDSFWADKFFPSGAILKGDDDARASFDTLLSDAMLQALATGKAIAQIDTRIATGADNLEAQTQAGELEPYVILHPRSALWDWEADKDGFKFVKLHQFRMVRGRWFDPPIPEHDFTIYERQEDGSIFASRYTVRKRLQGQEKPPKGPLALENLKDQDVDITPVLEPSPIFNLRGKFKFPVVTLTLPDALWIADQIYELQKSYFNQTAALEWGIFTTNYAMPIINGVEDEDDDPVKSQKFGDGYYLTLRTGQTLSWTERGGSGFGVATNYRSEIKRDIYDVLEQVAMSAADGSAIIARSGASKQEDRRPAQLLLEKYGSLAREFGKQILDVAAIAHNEDVAWEIEGYTNFMGEGLIEDITDFQGIQGVQVPSLTFKRETAKSFAKRVAQALDVETSKITTILEELEKAEAKDFSPPQPGASDQQPPEEQPPGEAPQQEPNAPQQEPDNPQPSPPKRTRSGKSKVAA